MPPEQVQRALDDYFIRLNSMDAEQYLGAFADDAVQHDPVGAPPIESQDVRRQFHNGITSLFEAISIQPDHVYIVGNRVAMNWSGRCTTKDGKVVQFEGIDTLIFTDAGKIQAQASYWDEDAMMAQIED